MITSKGTKITLTPSTKIPNGFNMPTVEAFNDWNLRTQRLTLSIDRDDVKNADPAVTLGNIVSDNTVGIEAQIEGLLDVWFDGSNNPNTIEFWVHLMGYGSNLCPADATSELLGDDDATIKADVIAYIRITQP